MQLLFDSETVIDENNKMSVVEVPESVTEKLGTNIIDQKLHTDSVKNITDRKNELEKESTSGDEMLIDNNIQKVDDAHSVSEKNNCNGKEDNNSESEISGNVENDHSNFAFSKLNGNPNKTYECSLPKETDKTESSEDDSSVMEKNDLLEQNLEKTIENISLNVNNGESCTTVKNKLTAQNETTNNDRTSAKEINTIINESIAEAQYDSTTEINKKMLAKKEDECTNNSIFPVLNVDPTTGGTLVNETNANSMNSNEEIHVKVNDDPSFHEKEKNREDTLLTDENTIVNKINEEPLTTVKQEDMDIDSNEEQNPEEMLLPEQPRNIETSQDTRNIDSNDIDMKPDISESVLETFNDNVNIKNEQSSPCAELECGDGNNTPATSDNQEVLPNITDISESVSETFDDDVNIKNKQSSPCAELECGDGNNILATSDNQVVLPNMAEHIKTEESDESVISTSEKAVNLISSEECNKVTNKDKEVSEVFVKNDVVEQAPTCLQTDKNNDLEETSTNLGIETSENAKDLVISVDEPDRSSRKNNEDESMDIDDVEKVNELTKENLCDHPSSNVESNVVTKSVEQSKEDSTIKETTIWSDKNTLDITSDSDDDNQTSNVANTSAKQCINLIDDDDVMLVEDDSISKDPINKDTETLNTVELDNSNKTEEPKDSSVATDQTDKGEISSSDELKDAVSSIVSKPTSPTSEFDDDKILDKGTCAQTDTKDTPEKPLIPIEFIKSCKPALSDMTKDNLEEFCLRMIVEGIMDRSNLSEIKNKLKTMSQSAEEWRKKAMMLTKQIRDLQIVLKTVQEEQKKNSARIIAPLRITRSVGMQVYMAESNKSEQMASRARRPMPSCKTRQTPAPPVHIKIAPKSTAAPAIPVPRLVPAPNSPAKPPARTPPPPPQLQSAAVSSNTGRPASTPVANSPPQTRSAEKRPLSTTQSMTVDLTDDEPPAKQPARAQGALRVVPQQQLVASPRVNAPRKVYIPISGPQTQNIRPGQTIMFKTVSPSNQRMRNPSALGVRLPTPTPPPLRVGQRPGNRHPAPLPEAPKQAQPPNWKCLPPAPDLKISKVENGIVISWKIEGYQEDNWEEIASYQLYAYQETNLTPSTMLWKKIGDVKALPLPMACTLTQFMAGYKYYFAVRAVDIRSRIGPFSLPGSILLLNK